MKRTLLLGLLMLAALAQLAAPGWMIWTHERVLQQGHVFKLKTAPVDPYDAFRGRYVRLSYEQETVKWTPGDWQSGEPVYVQLTEGTDGFATVTKLSREKLPGDETFVATLLWVGSRNTLQEIHLQFPFDRFYVEESKAPRIERDYREHSSRKTQDAYVTVRVHDGTAVIENLYIDNRPILEYIRTREK